MKLRLQRLRQQRDYGRHLIDSSEPVGINELLTYGKQVELLEDKIIQAEAKVSEDMMLVEKAKTLSAVLLKGEELDWDRVELIQRPSKRVKLVHKSQPSDSKA